MSLLQHFGYPYSLVLQAMALIHFYRRRPDNYWIWIILMLGPLGALAYLCVEALPDTRLLVGTFKVFPRRKRIQHLEILLRDNPSAGNWEEIGDLLMEDGKMQRAREAFSNAIAARSMTVDCFYRRALCALELGEIAAAVPDLEYTIQKEPDFDFNRAPALLAHAWAQTGQPEKAETLFRRVTQTSTLSETYLNFATLLASTNKAAEARQWTQKILDKQHTMPGYLRRRERPWFRKAKKLMAQLPA